MEGERVGVELVASLVPGTVEGVGVAVALLAAAAAALLLVAGIVARLGGVDKKL